MSFDSKDNDDEDTGTLYDTNDTDRMKTRTMEWIEKVVVGLRLCPFAERPMRKREFALHVVRGGDTQDIAAKLFAETERLRTEPGTAIVVAPDFHPDDFHAYLDYVSTIEEDMAARGLTGVLQLAPFHPHFQFGGSGPDDVDNYTNRSPYPMFHVLREAEVTHAAESLGGDASQIWGRNVDLLETLEDVLGRDAVDRVVLHGETDLEGVRDIVEEVDALSDEEGEDACI